MVLAGLQTIRVIPSQAPLILLQEAIIMKVPDLSVVARLKTYRCLSGHEFKGVSPEAGARPVCSKCWAGFMEQFLANEITEVLDVQTQEGQAHN